MNDLVIFLVGAVFGGILIWLWIQIRGSYKKARGLMQARTKAKAEKEKATKKAKEDIAKGRKEMLRTTAFTLVALLVIIIVAAIIVVAVGI